jgi:nucleotide-binding universal stress UspA family protein
MNRAAVSAHEPRTPVRSSATFSKGRPRGAKRSRRGVFRRILVPVDFSESSRRALAAAVDLAVTHDGCLTVLTAIAPATSLAGIRPPGGPVWYPPEGFIQAERRRLERLVAGIMPPRNPPEFRCCVVVGEPYEQIMAAARHADSIVMATMGRSGLSHVLIGSVAEKVVRHAPVPVLTIGPAVDLRTRRRGRPFGRKP